MKTFITLGMLLMSLTTLAADRVVGIFTLDHQMSSSCEKRIKTNIRYEKGVQNIEVSLKENTISIVYNPEKTNTGRLLTAFRKIGFNASLVSNKAESKADKQKKDSKKKN